MTMTDIVKAPPFMPSKPQWDATVKLLERALEELAQAQAERDAAHAEVARLTNVIGFIEGELEMSIGVGPFWDVMHDVHLFRGSLIDLCLAQLPESLRGQPAPTHGQEKACLPEMNKRSTK